MDTPPTPTNLPHWASDELPLLTETIGEPAIPLLSERLPDTPESPAPAASVKNAALSVSRLGRPKEMFDTPSTV